MQATCLALSLNPSAQDKAQAELDAVVGPDRLPNFEDRASLVYVNAITKEALRWFNVTPRHCALHDQRRRIPGLLHPGGSLLVANIWYVL